jgi:hypothetical protein
VPENLVRREIYLVCEGYGYQGAITLGWKTKVVLVKKEAEIETATIVLRGFLAVVAYRLVKGRRAT